MKRIIALLLVIVIAVSLAACASSGAPATSGVDTSSTTAAPSETAGDGGDAATGPYKVKLMGLDTAQIWDNRENHEVWKAFEELRKAHNLELEFEVVAKEQYTQVVQTRTAAAMDLPDVLRIQELDLATILNLGSQGVLLDAKALIDTYSNGKSTRSSKNT